VGEVHSPAEKRSGLCVCRCPAVPVLPKRGGARDEETDGGPRRKSFACDVMHGGHRTTAKNESESDGERIVNESKPSSHSGNQFTADPAYDVGDVAMAEADDGGGGEANCDARVSRGGSAKWSGMRRIVSRSALLSMRRRGPLAMRRYSETRRNHDDNNPAPLLKQNEGITIRASDSRLPSLSDAVRVRLVASTRRCMSDVSCGSCAWLIRDAWLTVRISLFGA
jgi:hypothetical protein